MKNMKIARKLIVSFLIVAALTLITGVVGIIGMSQISSAGEDLYNYNLVAVDSMGEIQNAISNLRLHYRNIVLYNTEDSEYQNSVKAINDLDAVVLETMEIYRGTIIDKDDEANFAKIETAYNDMLMGQAIPEILAYGAVNDNVNAQAAMEKYAPQINELVNMITVAVADNMEYSEQSIKQNNALYVSMTIASVVIIIVAVTAALILGLYISKLISAPIVVLTSFMNGAGSLGDITLRPEDLESIKKYSSYKDEVGQCIGSTAKFIEHISRVANELGKIADGDLSARLNVLSEKDVIGVAMRQMLTNLNEMFNEINMSTEQVSDGAAQISEGAQSLAEGSTEQAASVEELSSSIGEVASLTKDNAQMASKAATLSDNIKKNAEDGTVQMDKMMGAVKEINEASQNISKVIKVIDDIAFQTNILALNAAVEAARAGEHGKGFAVVAEEVRNLAAKSAEAAKDTSSMIANSIEKAELGEKIAVDTAKSLADIVDGINESTVIINDIAHSSEDQTVRISEINTGIDQVAAVVQRNSATAEESAASSEEMNSQSETLKSLVARFKLA